MPQEVLDPATSFEPHRRRLLGLAYRMLGSMADAEDAVQETYLRWHRSDRAEVVAPRAFPMTRTTRICLDMLTPARGPARGVRRPVAAGAGARHDRRRVGAEHDGVPAVGHARSQACASCTATGPNEAARSFG